MADKVFGENDIHIVDVQPPRIELSEAERAAAMELVSRLNPNDLIAALKVRAETWASNGLITMGLLQKKLNSVIGHLRGGFNDEERPLFLSSRVGNDRDVDTTVLAPVSLAEKLFDSARQRKMRLVVKEQNSAEFSNSLMDKDAYRAIAEVAPGSVIKVGKREKVYLSGGVDYRISNPDFYVFNWHDYERLTGNSRPAPSMPPARGNVIDVP